MTENRDLKRLYSEIVKGFTPVKTDWGVSYIKHFSIEDQYEVDEFYVCKLAELEQSGIPSEKMVLEFLEKKKVWGAIDEVEIAQKELYIRNLEKTKGQKYLPSDVEYFDSLIADEMKILREKKTRRVQLLGRTRESFANEATNNFFVLKSFRKDRECLVPLISDSDFQSMEDEELLRYHVLYNSAMSEYTGNGIKKVSIQPFFQDVFYLAESVYEFWGKPIKDLTIYQSQLSSYARYFKSAIQNSEVEIPEEIRNDPDKLISFFSVDKKMREQISKGTGHNVSVQGTAEDFQKLGIKTQNPHSVWARKLRRNLTRDDMLAIDRGEGHLLK
jgi:hypothetical protein